MKLNDIAIGKVKNKNEFFKFMDELNLKGDKFIIKPNWVDGIWGSFTEAKVLEFIFEYLKDKKIFITESYTAWRNRPFVEEGREEIDRYKGDLAGAKLKWDWIKEQDKWFLEKTGIGKLLKKYNVEYINITEEVWSGRTANRKIIKKIVEEKYEPVRFEEFYSYVPQKLFDLKGATFISFSKLKTEFFPFGITGSTKNMFGLIPDPSRWKYHGENHEFIPQSVADINKIYRSLFKTVFIVEGIFTALSDYMENPKVVKDLGQITGGSNSAEVDAVTATMAGLDYKKIGYLPLVIETFGEFDREILNKIPKEFIKSLK